MPRPHLLDELDGVPCRSGSPFQHRLKVLQDRLQLLRGLPEHLHLFLNKVPRFLLAPPRAAAAAAVSKLLPSERLCEARVTHRSLLQPAQLRAVVREGGLERGERMAHPPAAPLHVHHLARASRAARAAAGVSCLPSRENVPDLCRLVFAVPDVRVVLLDLALQMVLFVSKQSRRRHKMFINELNRRHGRRKGSPEEALANVGTVLTTE